MDGLQQDVIEIIGKGMLHLCINRFAFSYSMATFIIFNIAWWNAAVINQIWAWPDSLLSPRLWQWRNTWSWGLEYLINRTCFLHCWHKILIYIIHPLIPWIIIAVGDYDGSVHCVCVSDQRISILLPSRIGSRHDSGDYCGDLVSRKKKGLLFSRAFDHLMCNCNAWHSSARIFYPSRTEMEILGFNVSQQQYMHAARLVMCMLHRRMVND